MFRYLISLIAITFIFASCANTQKAAESSSIKETIQNDQVEFSEENAKLSEDNIFATMKRGYCYGTCPVFELKIYNNGTVTLHAIANLELEGLFSAKLSKEEMAAFAQKAKDIKYMDMEDVYDNAGISDLPSTTTSIVLNGVKKQVVKRYGYPIELKAFEKLFDALIESENWVKTPEPKQK
ncbi:MAG: DUF6438 domain-containing protein [Crocinitomicaceae bacterium]|nr:DUF6438 domain-containing protein [Crocinitomicaceae bacterium]